MLNRIRIPRVAVLVALVMAMTFAVSDAAPKAPAGKITRWRLSPAVPGPS
jgi:hypothetical protein